mgnify:CR=1 FL=1
MPRILCPHCQHRFSLPRDWDLQDGEEFKCPACWRDFAVGADRVPPPIEEHDERPSGAPHDAAP